MFYQEALRVDNLLTIGGRHWRKVATTFETAESANSLPFAWNRYLFIWGAYFCMGAYKRNVIVVIKMGAYIHGVLILCILSRFYGMLPNLYQFYSSENHIFQPIPLLLVVLLLLVLLVVLLLVLLLVVLFVLLSVLFTTGRRKRYS